MNPTDLVTVCEKDPRMYMTNRDCAQLVDTCLHHFPDNKDCQIYRDRCGVNNYLACVEELTYGWGACSCRRDTIEVQLETGRLKNQLKQECKPHTLEDIRACYSWQDFVRKMAGWFGY